LESCTLAPDCRIANGMPSRSTTRWRFEPDLPRSVGFGPVLAPPRAPVRSPHPGSPDSNQSARLRVAVRAAPDGAAPTRRPPANRASAASPRPGPDGTEQVMPEPQPSSCDSISQGIPLLSTKMMPLSALRSSTRGRPPLGFAGSAGSKGAMTAHSSSVTSCCAIPECITTRGFVRRT
jgi:hypothetical protein